MRRFSFLQQMELIREWLSGPALIGAGMSTLLLGMWLPGMPVVTAMSLVTLGATDVTLTRFRDTSVLVSIVLLHSTTYGALYAVFVGAALHGVTESPVAGLDLSAILDLAASALPAAAAVRRIVVSLQSQFAA